MPGVPSSVVALGSTIRHTPQRRAHASGDDQAGRDLQPLARLLATALTSNRNHGCVAASVFAFLSILRSPGMHMCAAYVPRHRPSISTLVLSLCI